MCMGIQEQSSCDEPCCLSRVGAKQSRLMAVQMPVDVIFLDILLPNVVVVETCLTAGTCVTGMMLLLVFYKTDSLFVHSVAAILASDK